MLAQYVQEGVEELLPEKLGPLLRLRYHNVYGPRMPRDTPYAGVASIFRSAVQAGVAPRVFEDGGQRRDFVHVSDIVQANLLAMEKDEANYGVFNVGSGRPVTGSRSCQNGRSTITKVFEDCM